ncbi:MAG: amino acid decarboxylase [Clostridiales bacterium]|nr:amino acid decarboxylase [Clostridiales bacterium]
MNSTTPLYHALWKHTQKKQSSFHTPGHKGKANLFPDGLLSLDLTELPDTDSLFEASGTILQAEQEAARVLGTKRTLFSAGGCTLCIQAMLRLATQRGKRTVIAGRVLHRSAVHTMALLDLQPVWLLPRPDAGKGFCGRIHPEDVAAALERHPDAACVYVTSPDYFGVLADLEGIAKACRKYDVPLLVDNAHGAHLFFTSQPHPIAQGAAMTACSAHKTLPVLTGGAWLNIGDPRFVSEAKEAMALFGSTSPSYLVMASLDLCTRWMEQEAKDAYRNLERTVRRLRKAAMQEGMALPQGPVDPTRISLNTAAAGMSGEQAAEHFRACGVEPEYADDASLVLIPTPWNARQDFQRVCYAIHTMPKRAPLELPEAAFPPLPPMAVSLREALFALGEEVPLSKAVGRIAASAACPCPPGVPVVMPGEKITPEAAEFLQKYGFFTAKVLK